MGRNNREYKEQKAFFEYCAWREAQDPRYGDIIAVPNGAHLASGPRSWMTLKAIGAKKGFPDIVCFVPMHPWHGLIIEMKAHDKAKVSDEQKKWITRLIARQYLAAIAYSCEEALDILHRYFKGHWSTSPL